MKHTNKTEAGRFNSSHKNGIEVLIETIGYDGHTIWNPDVLMCFPSEIQKRFTQTYKSNKRSPKETIYSDGQPVKEMTGVYGLTLLRGICSDLGLKYEDAMGRGTEARNATASIVAWLKTA